MTSPFTQALEQLEPVARLFKDGGQNPVAFSVAFSIAVSLKRIADSQKELVGCLSNMGGSVGDA